MDMLKKNLSIILVIVLTLLLVAMVIWVFNKRIESMDGKTKPATSKTNALHISAMKTIAINYHSHLKKSS
jgi:uncharacterized membrane protein AbrB (regulator of aidB expression)